MAFSSTIEWTEATWNPVTGCSKISAGCTNCYAERMARRLKAMGLPHYSRGFEVAIHKEALSLPFRWRRPKMIFVNSMSDLFHEKIPDDFISRVFDVMNRASWHRFQILTKRSGRLSQMSPILPWADNIWMGVTVEDQRCAFRIDHLRNTSAKIRFLSMEPLLGPITHLDLTGVHWVIVGGESGPRARPLNSEWVMDIKAKCKESKIPFFFKQWGGVNKKKRGRLLDGRLWNEMPHAI
ncbi:MAG: phage Gp37/Gp68 family protein [Candidatus Aminicenantales bacterium]